MPKFQISDVCSAFEAHTIGTKVTSSELDFILLVGDALKKYDVSNDSEPGQHFLILAKEAVAMVSCGVGRHTGHQDDYVVRVHRGEPGVFLTRENAAECTGVAAIVYTREAYLADPQVTPERAAALHEDTAYILVAVLGFADAPKPEVSSHRFVRNLAGGNNEYDMLARSSKLADDFVAESNKPEEGRGSDKWQSQYAYHLEREVEVMVKRAKATVEYGQTWCTVAD